MATTMEKQGFSMTQRSRPSLVWLIVVDDLIMPPPSVEDSRLKAVVMASPLFYPRKDGCS